jgi:hypothetical protein
VLRGLVGAAGGWPWVGLFGLLLLGLWLLLLTVNHDIRQLCVDCIHPGCIPTAATACPLLLLCFSLQTENTQRYIEVCERIGGRAGPQYAADR